MVLASLLTAGESKLSCFGFYPYFMVRVLIALAPARNARQQIGDLKASLAYTLWVSVLNPCLSLTSFARNTKILGRNHNSNSLLHALNQCEISFVDNIFGKGQSQCLNAEV